MGVDTGQGRLVDESDLDCQTGRASIGQWQMVRGVGLISKAGGSIASDITATGGDRPIAIRQQRSGPSGAKTLPDGEPLLVQMLRGES